MARYIIKIGRKQLYITPKQAAELGSEIASIANDWRNRLKPGFKKHINHYSWHVNPTEKQHICPNCGYVGNGKKHDNCDWVFGRRGWRQLGVYDG